MFSRSFSAPKEILVDIDQREVVALGLRDNMLSLSGMPQYIYITSIRKIGDVILVDNEDAIETVDIDQAIIEQERQDRLGGNLPFLSN